jgi:ppGpp synthetase/RelA/SpoT-type nucleotidyltranferase
MDADVLSNVESDRGGGIDPSVDTISSFIADWVQIKYFYSEAASLAQELCETLLASNAIRAIVTHRVKQGHRLEAKLRERVRKLGREYRSAREIRDDIVDLAGVRIALYFPSDREKINKIIHDAFAEVTHETFPEQDEKRASDSMSQMTETSFDFQQRFNGYSADHYRVRMRVENLATKKLRDDFQKTNPVIEIQVASVLMHAWAEIDHDLVHKTLTSGPASQQELRLLDATNGLVHTGEVLLQQLQTAMDDRVSYQQKPFSEQYELLSFLRGQLKKVKGSMEHLDVLLLVFDPPGLPTTSEVILAC